MCLKRAEKQIHDMKTKHPRSHGSYEEIETEKYGFYKTIRESTYTQIYRRKKTEPV